MPRILIIDDERGIRNTLREILEYEKYSVDDAANGVEGLERARQNEYDVVMCDIKMSGIDGIEVLQQLQQFSDVPVIMISGHGTIDTAVDAIKKGAYDYISKPPDLNRLLVAVRNAVDKVNLVSQAKVLKKKLEQKFQIVGTSEPMSAIYDMIGKVAPTNARVLITGENGSGKELVARALHQGSPRSTAPFIEVNCAAIPSELIESELFGHEKGSFTSAIKQRKGDFELAHNGTIFLDEIGDMSLSAQAKVLRVLQENKLTRVGGEKEIVVDVRVIAATNKDLRKEIENGSFREDLYHRLSVILIKVPSLAERRADIPLLIEHFSNEIVGSMGRAPLQFSEDAISILQELPWTGNVRELRNVIERLAILCDRQVTAEDVDKYASPLR
ncbi:MAG TPA: response regulator [Bacteroidales bacterium]|nr:MAG: Fis family transcriptional regulator [Bacteroidetes bacterium GWE2_42_24]OFY28908.1 MAG: Fis family transcriptional regulator [Bacteroidetes bacterium GWF2_43_11]PKP27587.1 MAG: response regulator [Bacteroidetes bacterium HGW-Bacteroidetes-22]HBZ67727.1 response regulator [Bacteroidales bacterium]